MEITEKRLLAVPPKAFIGSGDVYGRAPISDASQFRVKQVVTVVATGQPILVLEVKRVESPTSIILGPKGGSIDTRTDLSAYSIGNSAFVFADEQTRPVVPIQDIQRAVYEEEPAVAIRTLPVDQYGTPISPSNPLPIEGTISVQLDGPTMPAVANIPAPTVGEYSHVFPAATKRFHIKMRGNSGMKVGWAAGSTSTNYMSISPGSTLSEDNLQLTAPLVLYIGTTRASDTIEILYWT